MEKTTIYILTIVILLTIVFWFGLSHLLKECEEKGGVYLVRANACLKSDSIIK